MPLPEVRDVLSLDEDGNDDVVIIARDLEESIWTVLDLHRGELRLMSFDENCNWVDMTVTYVPGDQNG